MERFSTVAIVASLAVIFAVLFNFYHEVKAAEEDIDIELIMSDMPLKGDQLVKMQLVEEHQANDSYGVVYILIGVETCNGNPI